MFRKFVFMLLCLSYIPSRALKPRRKPFCELADQAARFNFTNLSPVDHVIVDDKFHQTIRLRLCAPLSKPCNGMTHYSICLIKDDVQIGIGKTPPDKTVASSGQLKFEFTGEPCNGDKKYSVEIIMKCDNEADNATAPELFPHETDQCTFYMVWKTKVACAKEHIVNCKAVDRDNQNYDLTPLMLRSENYKLPVPNANDSVIILNVCHSVVYEYDATCPPKSAACLRRRDNEKNKIVFEDLGGVTGEPEFDNGVLVLKYQLGMICRQDIRKNTEMKTSGHIETVMSFECNHRATNTLPEYVGGANDCIYRFRWTTAAACSIESLKNRSLFTAEKCKATDPASNIEYDFQQLMSKDFHSKSPNGTIYTFQVCGSLTDNDCPGDAGACDVERNISMGKANTNFIWSNDGPYLNYTDGTECGKNKRWYTQIAFFCGPEESISEPIVMQDADCALIIYWNTRLACHKEIKCQTKYGGTDLTSLIRLSDNYVVKERNSQYILNVCRPLVPKSHFNWVRGSAACQVTLQANGQFVNETSLGYPDENPLIDEENRVILRYNGGSVCPENKRHKLSSNLTFLCDHSSGIGTPRYKYYRNCTHVFEWTTSVVCEKIEGRWTTDCMIENPRLSQIIDLKSFHKKPVYNVKTKVGDWYNVSLCGGGKYCDGFGICKGEKNYGSVSSAVFDYTRNAIIVQFSHGSRCKGGFHSAEVRFICDEDAGTGEPILIDEVSNAEMPCSVTFEWNTKAVCGSHQLMTKIDKEAEGNKEPTSTGYVGKYIGIAILVSCCVALIVYLFSRQCRTRLRQQFNSFTTRRDRCRAQYTKVRENVL